MGTRPRVYSEPCRATVDGARQCRPAVSVRGFPAVRQRLPTHQGHDGTSGRHARAVAVPPELRDPSRTIYLPTRRVLRGVPFGQFALATLPPRLIETHEKSEVESQ